LRKFAVNTSLSALFLAILSAAPCAQAAEPADAARALPINLDAKSSEIDRINGHVLFRGLKIAQGALAIEADTGEASRLDFEDARWTFKGHVMLEDGATRVYCDEANVAFTGHELRVAVLKGTPARFEKLGRTDKQTAKGRATELEYNLDSGLISLSGDAWVTDGSNEVSGEKLSYDLLRDFVLADSSGGKQVRMRINPPQRKPSTGKTP
jgi:lipopolysaccharide export system protein LptA